MATTHLGLVVYGCVVAAILRSQGVASAPIEGEVANVKANQNGDLEQQLMQQSGENKSSQPSSSSVNHGAAAVDPADPQGQDSSVVDEVGDGGDDVEATGLSSDYYGEATQLERLNGQLREEEDDGIKDIPAAAAAAGPAEEEEDRNSNVQLLQDEETNNGRNKEGYNINFQERSFENDAKKIENNEENKNRAFRIDDDIEQMERPWENANDFEGQEAPPSGEAAAAEKKEIRNDDGDGDAAHEKGRDNESTNQPKEKEEGEEEGEGEGGEGERARIDRQNIEQLRYTEDGQRNTAETFDSRLLISREKKTLQGKIWRAAEPDKPDMHQRDDESRLGYVDDGSFNEEEVYM